MAISNTIKETIKNSSWIRKMFEQGLILKKKYGADKVFDFSLGNPDLEPPESFFSALKQVSLEQISHIHGYMPNSGFPEVRKEIASGLSKQFSLPFDENNILMTVGAAGGINVILKTLLDPNDEVIVVKPYFVEYGFYITNHGGKMKLSSSDSSFLPDFDELESNIKPNTKAIIINTPNNPTGVVYNNNILKRLASLLDKKSEEYNHPVYLISDEPYKMIYYKGDIAPSPIQFYKNTIATTSFSKDLSLPGERIGYIAIRPDCDSAVNIFNGATFANRILGFVNAPALMQRVVGKLFGISVDKNIYRKRRDMLCKGLSEAGYEFNIPDGAFYLFPKSPIKNDVEFAHLALEEKILITPGTGFGAPGYFRISYCVSEDTIERSMLGFKRLIDNCMLIKK